MLQAACMVQMQMAHDHCFDISDVSGTGGFHGGWKRVDIFHPYARGTFQKFLTPRLDNIFARACVKQDEAHVRVVE